MSAETAVYAVLAVEEARKRITIDAPKAITFFSVNDAWVYTAIMDNRVCDACLQHEFKTYRGDELRALFPYLEVVDLEKILPHVHPNCRCELDRVLFMGDIGVELP